MNPPASSKIWGPELTGAGYNCLVEKFGILLAKSSGIEIRSDQYWMVQEDLIRLTTLQALE